MKKAVWIFVILSLILGGLTMNAVAQIGQFGVLVPEIKSCYYCINSSGDVVEGFVINKNLCPEGSIAIKLPATGEECMKIEANSILLSEKEKIDETNTLNQLISLGAIIEDLDHSGGINLNDAFELRASDECSERKIRFNNHFLEFPCDVNARLSNKKLYFYKDHFTEGIEPNYIINYGFVYDAFPLQGGDTLVIEHGDLGGVVAQKVYSQKGFFDMAKYETAYASEDVITYNSPIEIYEGIASIVPSAESRSWFEKGIVWAYNKINPGPFE